MHASGVGEKTNYHRIIRAKHHTMPGNQAMTILPQRKRTFALHFFIVVSLLAIAASTDIQNRIIADETLIIPGLGAEKASLGESMGSIIARLGTPLRTAKIENAGEVFQTIFHVASEVKIPFDAIYYYGDERGIFFLHQNSVSAIAGNPKNRVTDSAVSLDKGIQNCIFHYGNEGLTIVPKGKHRAYFYFQKGIALFDDNSDDDIDLYVVFRPNTAP